MKPTISDDEVGLRRNSEPDIPDSPLKTVHFRWTGLAPLVMSNVRGVDPDDPLVIEIKKLTDKKAKDTDTRQRITRMEWELSAYWDPKLGFYIPAENIEAALREGGAKSKKGKKIQAGAFVSGSQIPFLNQKYKTLDQAFADPAYRLRCAVRLPPRTGARVMKTRCRMPVGWVLEFTVECHPTIDESVLEEAAEQCGLFVGLSNWRPKNGRFTSEIL